MQWKLNVFAKSGRNLLVNLSYFDVIEKGKEQQKARKDKKEMSEKGDLDSSHRL